MTLPVPAFFDSACCGEVWRVPYQERAAAAAAWAMQHGISPARNDRRRVGLLLIDCQNTFCIPGYELFVGGRSGRGAVDDSARICAFIYRNLDVITEIVATLDTHTAWQIFHPAFLVDEAGRHPPPATIVSAADVSAGRWRVSPAAGPAQLQDHLRYYCATLEERGKYQLMVWPYHAMLGGIGHALVAAIEEAVFFHSIARQSPGGFEQKGGSPLVENYSALRPEVQTTADGQPLGVQNTALLERLLRWDVIVIAGQAKSHCVAWTVADLLAEMQQRDPALARKVYLLEDCTSAVLVPGADFTDEGEAAFIRFAAAGMHRVQSTTPMAEWPIS